MNETTGTHRRRRNTVLALGLAIGAMLVLAACGEGTPVASTAAATPAATPAPTPPATEEPAAAQEPSPSPTVTVSSGPNGECDATQLDFSLQSRPMDSGMSQFYWDLTMTNTSDTECTLEGYPTVTLLNANTDDVAGPPSGHESVPSVAATVVPLPPGASAYSLLHLSQAGAYACATVPVREVAVMPPHGDTSRAVATPNPIEGCEEASIELVRAGPLAAAPVTY